MSQYRPVVSLDDLRQLDDAEIIEGYWSGFEGWPEPGNNHSRSFWHGWRNGAVDGGFRQNDEAQTSLVRAYVAASRAA